MIGPVLPLIFSIFPRKAPVVLPPEPEKPPTKVVRLVEFVKPDPGITYLFEYGELQKHLGYVDYLSDPISDAYTIQKFTLWKDMEQTNVPLACDFGYASPRLVVPRQRVKGSLYIVPNEDLEALDTFRHNGVYFKRKKIQVNVPQPNANGEALELRAYIYEAGGKDWQSKVLWDQDFYREKSRYQPLSRYYDKSAWNFGEYYEFKAGDLTEKVQSPAKCSLYIKKNIPEPNVKAAA